jgi:hypothetical protein
VKPRRGLPVVRLVICIALFLLGLLVMVVGAVQAADGYSAAGTMAAAPQCPVGVDLPSATANCVGDLVLGSQDGMYPLDREESLALVVPPADGYFLWPSYPGNAAFDAVLGDSGSVRAEFWKGDVVTLTAARGDDVESVTTDANPNNKGGTGVGIALLGASLADLAVLLLIGVRVLRYRWLRPGLGLRLTVSAMIVCWLGLFVASICLINQPARVLLTLAVAPAVTAGVLLLVWLVVRSTWQRRGLRGQRGY